MVNPCCTVPEGAVVEPRSPQRGEGAGPPSPGNQPPRPEAPRKQAQEQAGPSTHGAAEAGPSAEGAQIDIPTGTRNPLPPRRGNRRAPIVRQGPRIVAAPPPPGVHIPPAAVATGEGQQHVDEPARPARRRRRNRGEQRPAGAGPAGAEEPRALQPVPPAANWGLNGPRLEDLQDPRNELINYGHRTWPVADTENVITGMMGFLYPGDNPHRSWRLDASLSERLHRLCLEFNQYGLPQTVHADITHENLDPPPAALNPSWRCSCWRHLLGENWFNDTDSTLLARCGNDWVTEQDILIHLLKKLITAMTLSYRDSLVFRENNPSMPKRFHDKWSFENLKILEKMMARRGTDHFDGRFWELDLPYRKLVGELTGFPVMSVTKKIVQNKKTRQKRDNQQLPEEEREARRRAQRSRNLEPQEALFWDEYMLPNRVMNPSFSWKNVNPAVIDQYLRDVCRNRTDDPRAMDKIKNYIYHWTVNYRGRRGYMQRQKAYAFYNIIARANGGEPFSLENPRQNNVEWIRQACEQVLEIQRKEVQDLLSGERQPTDEEMRDEDLMARDMDDPAADQQVAEDAEEGAQDGTPGPAVRTPSDQERPQAAGPHGPGSPGRDQPGGVVEEQPQAEFQQPMLQTLLDLSTEGDETVTDEFYDLLFGQRSSYRQALELQTTSPGQRAPSPLTGVPGFPDIDIDISDIEEILGQPLLQFPEIEVPAQTGSPTGRGKRPAEDVPGGEEDARLAKRPHLDPGASTSGPRSPPGGGVGAGTSVPRSPPRADVGASTSGPRSPPRGDVGASTSAPRSPPRGDVGASDFGPQSPYDLQVPRGGGTDGIMQELLQRLARYPRIREVVRTLHFDDAIGGFTAPPAQIPPLEPAPHAPILGPYPLGPIPPERPPARAPPPPPGPPPNVPVWPPNVTGPAPSLPNWGPNEPRLDQLHDPRHPLINYGHRIWPIADPDFFTAGMMAFVWPGPMPHRNYLNDQTNVERVRRLVLEFNQYGLPQTVHADIRHETLNPPAGVLNPSWRCPCWRHLLGENWFNDTDATIILRLGQEWVDEQGLLIHILKRLITAMVNHYVRETREDFERRNPDLAAMKQLNYRWTSEQISLLNKMLEKRGTNPYAGRNWDLQIPERQSVAELTGITMDAIQKRLQQQKNRRKKKVAEERGEQSDRENRERELAGTRRFDLEEQLFWDEYLLTNRLRDPYFTWSYVSEEVKQKFINDVSKTGRLDPRIDDKIKNYVHSFMHNEPQRKGFRQRMAAYEIYNATAARNNAPPYNSRAISENNQEWINQACNQVLEVYRKAAEDIRAGRRGPTDAELREADLTAQDFAEPGGDQPQVQLDEQGGPVDGARSPRVRSPNRVPVPDAPPRNEPPEQHPDPVPRPGSPFFDDLRWQMDIAAGRTPPGLPAASASTRPPSTPSSGYMASGSSAETRRQAPTAVRLRPPMPGSLLLPQASSSSTSGRTAGASSQAYGSAPGSSGFRIPDFTNVQVPQTGEGSQAQGSGAQAGSQPQRVRLKEQARARAHGQSSGSQAGAPTLSVQAQAAAPSASGFSIPDFTHVQVPAAGDLQMFDRLSSEGSQAQGSGGQAGTQGSRFSSTQQTTARAQAPSSGSGSSARTAAQAAAPSASGFSIPDFTNVQAPAHGDVQMFDRVSSEGSQGSGFSVPEDFTGIPPATDLEMFDSLSDQDSQGRSGSPARSPTRAPQTPGTSQSQAGSRGPARSPSPARSGTQNIPRGSPYPSPLPSQAPGTSGSTPPSGSSGLSIPSLTGLNPGTDMEMFERLSEGSQSQGRAQGPAIPVQEFQGMRVEGQEARPELMDVDVPGNQRARSKSPPATNRPANPNRSPRAHK